MILIGETLLSEDLFDEEFVCNLGACKGACCVEGDAGAPLEEHELGKLEEAYDLAKDYVPKAGQEWIDKLGTFTVDTDGDFVTSLVNGKECVFTTFDKNGTAKCGLENAHRDGVTQWKKPSSCHLYPIRIQKLDEYEALNYHKWNICSDACTLGKELKVPVFRFLKDPLITRYGEDWYNLVEEAFEVWKRDMQ